MKQFKIRCSGISQIMTQPQSKTDKEAGILSKTAKTYCENWVKGQIYQRSKEFSNKFTEKGILVEDNSIDFASEYLGLGMLFKNEEPFENDFLIGTPDVVTKDYLIDVKNSWDCFTFPLFDTEIPNDAYYWQAQGYMKLTDRNHYKLIYVLSDTPDHLIMREATYYAKNNGYDSLTQEIYDQFNNKMTYPDIENKYKIKVFEIERNDIDIQLIENQVMKCRNYITNLINNI